MQTFVTEAHGWPIESYTEAAGGIKLVKVAASAFKDRSAPRGSGGGGSGSSDDAPEDDRAARKAKRDKARKSSSSSSSSSGEKEERARSHEKARQGIHEDSHHHGSAVEVDEDADVIEL